MPNLPPPHTHTQWKGSNESPKENSHPEKGWKLSRAMRTRNACKIWEQERGGLTPLPSPELLSRRTTEPEGGGVGPYRPGRAVPFTVAANFPPDMLLTRLQRRPSCQLFSLSCTRGSAYLRRTRCPRASGLQNTGQEMSNTRTTPKLPNTLPELPTYQARGRRLSNWGCPPSAGTQGHGGIETRRGDQAGGGERRLPACGAVRGDFGQGKA